MYEKNFEQEFETRKAQYEEAILKNVCAHCIDFGQDSICHKSGGRETCAVIRNLKELVYIAKSIHSKQVSSYVHTLREKVCSHCASSRPNGSCPNREEIECCVDRYLPLILQAIESIDSKN